MTSSAGTSGSILAGSPPRSAIASRIAARSTTAGTPVKSCMTTRAGVKAISWLGSALASHRASASMSAASTAPLPSVRRRFSSRILRLNGRRATSNFDCRAPMRKISSSRSPTFSVSLASKELGCSDEEAMRFVVLSAIGGEHHEGFPVRGGDRSEVLVEGGDAVGAQDAGEGDKRGVHETEERMLLGDAQGVAQALGPPAEPVGADLEVFPQDVLGDIAASRRDEVIHL